jgi:hypothetical protein
MTAFVHAPGCTVAEHVGRPCLLTYGYAVRTADGAVTVHPTGSPELSLAAVNALGFTALGFPLTGATSTVRQAWTFATLDRPRYRSLVEKQA